MRHNTMRILIGVALIGLIGIFGNIFLASRISVVADQYNEVINVYLVNEEEVANLKSDIYFIQSLISNHVVSTTEEEYDVYETRIDAVDEQIRSELENFSKRLNDADDKELIHQVANNYYAFSSQGETVIGLSRSGTKQTAEYYVCNEMADLVITANDNLERLNLKIGGEMEIAGRGLEKSLQTLSIVKYVSITLVIAAYICGSAIVAMNAKRILEQQTDTEKQHQQEIVTLQGNVIVGLANLIESRDGETGQHVKRTSDYVAMLTRHLRGKEGFEVINERFEENIYRAAPLHDIGKIKIPDSILQKPGKLTKEEFEIIKKHSTEGGNVVYGLLTDIESEEYLHLTHDVAMYHHEKWDGSGYPEGRKKEEIPLCARIMAVADVFDALLSKRCYKDAFPVEEAFSIIKDSAGTHFDPRIVETFMEMRPELEEYIQRAGYLR